MNPPLPLPLVDGAFFASGSFLEWCQTCTQGAKLYKIDARVSAAPASALNFGSHVHTCHEFRARQQEFGLSDAEIETRMAPILEAEFAREPIAEGDWRSLNWCSTLFHEHNKRYPANLYPMLKYAEPIACKYCKGTGRIIIDGPWKTNECPWCHGTSKQSLMVEVPFVVKLHDYEWLNARSEQFSSREEFDKFTQNGFSIPIYYHGFLDLPVEIGSQTFVQDYKTTSQLGDSFWHDKRASAQQKGYCWAFEQLTGRKVSGYLVRAIRTKEPPVYVINGAPSKKGETKKMEDWFNESFQEERFYLGDGELDEWRNNTIDLIEEFFWHYARGRFPRRTTWCAGKYGKCQYYDCCWTFPAADRDIILNSGLFKNKTPTPTA